MVVRGTFHAILTVIIDITSINTSVSKVSTRKWKAKKDYRDFIVVLERKKNINTISDGSIMLY